MRFLSLVLCAFLAACSSSVDYPIRIDSFATIDEAPRVRQALRDLESTKTPVSLGSIIDRFEEFHWSRQDQPPISSSHDALDHLTQKANS